MLRSMYAGITGLKANQTKLDVVGNNIANVGTTAFKSQKVKFKDSLSQTLASSSAPGNNVGGTNSKQIGLGVQIGGIDTSMSQGNMQPTGSNLDCAVDGDGFFIVASGVVPVANASGVTVDPFSHNIGNGNGLSVNFTRDGAFSLDANGNLLTADGLRILGYAMNEKGNPDVKSVDYSKNGVCNFVNSDTVAGLENADNTLVPLKIPDKVHIPATNIAKGKALKMTYTGTDNPGTSNPKIDTNGLYTGSMDLKIKVSYDNTNSKYVVSVNGATPIDIADFKTITVKDSAGVDKNISTDLNVNLDTNTMPTKDQNKHTWEFTVYADGDRKMRNFSIEKDGLIKGTLEDGRTTALGQLAMASFKNPAGLEKLGKNLYSNGSNSGVPVLRSSLGTAKEYDNSAGFGVCMNGNLEMSNVDLAEQFTEMIVASRAFQANGKMITTGDEILQDLVNLKR